MRTLLAIAGVLAGVVLWTAPAPAHGATVEKPIVTAEKDVQTGPRICLFSRNGKRAEPAPEVSDASPLPQDVASHPPIDDKQGQKTKPVTGDVAQAPPVRTEKREAVRQSQAAKATDRVCDTDIPAPTPPRG